MYLYYTISGLSNDFIKRVDIQHQRFVKQVGGVNVFKVLIKFNVSKTAFVCK